MAAAWISREEGFECGHGAAERYVGAAEPGYSIIVVCGFLDGAVEIHAQSFVEGEKGGVFVADFHQSLADVEARALSHGVVEVADRTQGFDGIAVFALIILTYSEDIEG